MRQEEERSRVQMKGEWSKEKSAGKEEQGGEERGRREIPWCFK